MTIFTSIFSLLLLLGCAINNLGQKYTTGTTAHCRTELFILSVPNSNICCDPELKLHNEDWVCVAAKDSTTKMLSFYMAYAIPLAPWVLNVLLDKYRDSSFRFSIDRSNSSVVQSLYRFLRPHFLRLGMYAVIFAFRLVREFKSKNCILYIDALIYGFPMLLCSFSLYVVHVLQYILYLAAGVIQNKL